MDRTLVHSKNKEQVANDGMNHTINIPFEDVPRELIEQLHDCYFSYSDYLSLCQVFNVLPTYWNFAIIEDKRIIAFVWGLVEPIERFAHILRISVLPEVRGDNDRVLRYIGDVLKEACREMGCTYAFFLTDKEHVFMNKEQSQERLKMSVLNVVEVNINENLH